jgi:chemotaxis protein histidine kinase CheA
MDELVQEFCLETNTIISELESLLEKLESNPSDFYLLETFGQKVDRIMGAAKSLEYLTIGTLTEFCKTISYKSAQSKNTELIIIVVAFLFEAVDALKEMSQSLSSKGEEQLDPVTSKTIFSRLEFISQKLIHIQRSSVAINDQDLLDLSDKFNQFISKK